MNIELQQYEEFRKWHEDEYGYCRLLTPYCHLRWEAWQASRASLVIELPACEPDAASEYSKGHRQGIRACREAIQSTGVKVK